MPRQYNPYTAIMGRNKSKGNEPEFDWKSYLCQTTVFLTGVILGMVIGIGINHIGH